MAGWGTTAAEARKELALRQKELEGADPFKRLGVTPGADRSVVHDAFLKLTKQHHPARFSRFERDVVDLATEVFLLIKGAHDELMDEKKHEAWARRVREPVAGRGKPVTSPPPMQAPANGGAPSAPARVASTTGPQAPLARPRTGTLSQPVAGQQPPAPTAPTQTQPPLARPRTRTLSTPSPVPAAQGTAPTAPTAPIAAGKGVERKRPPSTLPPGTFAGLSPDQLKDAIERAKTRGTRFDNAAYLITRKKYPEAIQAFKALCAEDPQSKKFRFHLAWACAMQEKELGNLEGAVRELEKALVIDPEHEEVRAEYSRLAPEAKKSASFLGKLFNR